MDYGLAAKQGLPLELKIAMTEMRIREWYTRWNGKVYVSFSGGRDSTVLLHIARKVIPGIQAVFSDTGLEYPEVRDFVSTISNVTIIRPEKSFLAVVNDEGYPVITKEQAQYIREYRTTESEHLRNYRWNGKGNARRSGKISERWKYLINAPFKISERCCDHLKKRPFHRFNKMTGMKPIIGIMAGDSSHRHQSAGKYGCIYDKPGFESLRPMIFWTDADVADYIRVNKLPISSIYTHGYNHTGCMFCGFGAHMNTVNKFEMMRSTHPDLYRYCMDIIGMGEVLDYCGIRR